MKLGNWMRSSLNRPLPVMMDPLKGVAEATEGERERKRHNGSMISGNQWAEKSKQTRPVRRTPLHNETFSFSAV